jgi:DNA-directed RNA polymerase subunit RPC12/RpoP
VPVNELFPIAKKPRAKPRIMMHLIDAGDDGCGNQGALMVCLFKCPKCNKESDWLPINTTTEGKKGVPCPKCNEVKND